MSELQSSRTYICCYFCSIVQTKYFPRGDIVKNLKMSLLDGPLTNCTLVLCTYWGRENTGVLKKCQNKKLSKLHSNSFNFLRKFQFIYKSKRGLCSLLTFNGTPCRDAMHTFLSDTEFQMIFMIVWYRDCSRRSFIYSTCLVPFKIKYVLCVSPWSTSSELAAFYDLH